MRVSVTKDASKNRIRTNPKKTANAVFPIDVFL